MHLFAQGDDARVAVAGAFDEGGVFDVGFVVAFDVAGDAAVGDAGVDGDEAVESGGLFEVLAEFVGEVDFGFKLEEVFFDGLAGAEVGAQGGFGSGDDLVGFAFFGHLFVDVAEFGADGDEAFADELLGFAGGFTAGVARLDVVGFDEGVEDVFGFARVVVLQLEDEDAGVFFIASGDGQAGEQGAGDLDGGLVVDDDGGVVPVAAEV